MANTIVKYILSRLLIVFAFFIVIWTGINWLNLVVRNLESILILSQDPVSLIKYLFFTLTVAVDRVFPFVAFLSAIYFAFKLQTSNELNGMQSLGMNNYVAYIPFFLFALIVLATDIYLKFELRPYSRVQMANLERNINTPIEIRHQHVRKFLEFPGNIILFVEEINDDGVLKDIFIHLNYDSSKDVSLTFLADTGHIEYKQNEEYTQPIVKLLGGRIYAHNHVTHTNYKAVFKQSLSINLEPNYTAPLTEVSAQGLIGIITTLLNPTTPMVEKTLLFADFNRKASKTLFGFFVVIIGGFIVIYGNSRRWNVGGSIVIASTIAFGSFFLGQFAEDFEWTSSTANLTLYVSSLPMFIATLLTLMKLNIIDKKRGLG